MTEPSPEGPAAPPVPWSVVWGDQVKHGDIIKTKLKDTEGRVVNLRRQEHRCMYGDHSHTRLGLIVELPDGSQHSLWVDETDTLSVRTQIPDGMEIQPSQENE